jgi:hypothetical protein
MEANARFGDGFRALILQRENGFAIMHYDVRLAIIGPSRAQIPNHEVINANFLTPGTHWQQVAEILHDAEPVLVAEWKREQEVKLATGTTVVATADGRKRAVARRRIDQLPEDLAQELIDSCLDASRRIRLERQVAYDRPVVLECSIGELTLLPITGTGNRLLLPFRLNNETGSVTGELVFGNSDPLALLIGEDVPYEDAVMAWMCALLGFADATCIDFETEAAVRRWAGSQGRPASRTPQSPSTPRVAPRRQPWPKCLEPIGRWVRYSGSFVAGHRRHLQDGQTASDEARDRARRVGITLHQHETWVRPHARGVPDDLEMRFRWHVVVTLERYRK